MFWGWALFKCFLFFEEAEGRSLLCWLLGFCCFPSCFLQDAHDLLVCPSFFLEHEFDLVFGESFFE